MLVPLSLDMTSIFDYVCRRDDWWDILHEKVERWPYTSRWVTLYEMSNIRNLPQPQRNFTHGSMVGVLKGM